MVGPAGSTRDGAFSRTTCGFAVEEEEPCWGLPEDWDCAAAGEMLSPGTERQRK